jgi:hypothetical protein
MMHLDFVNKAWINGGSKKAKSENPIERIWIFDKGQIPLNAIEYLQIL